MKYLTLRSRLVSRRLLTSAFSLARQVPFVAWALFVAIVPAAGTVALADVPRAEITMPAGFTSSVVATLGTESTDFAFLPDGRVLIAHKDGTVTLFTLNVSGPTQVLDLGPRVDGSDARGLLGISVDPDFQNNGYIYLYYVYQHDGAPVEGTRTSRLSRFTMQGETADLGSEVVLLGSVNGDSCNNFPVGADCVPADSHQHFGGSLAFAPDGTLFVTTGDGARTRDFDNTLRAQNLDLLSGKLLHITTTGEGLPTNPFYNGDPHANRSKVWAYGLRNPFRASVDPLSGMPFVADVGLHDWEEVNVVAPGANLGWPCFEGLDHTPTFGSQPACQDTYAQLPTDLAWPAYSYRARMLGSTVIGGPVYRDQAFPAEYRDTYFFADYGRSTVYAMRVDEFGVPIGAPTQFASGLQGPVALKVGPDGALYSISYNEGKLVRLGYAGGDVPPAIEPLPGGTLIAEYFPNVSLEGQPVSRRAEVTIDHEWSENGPGEWLNQSSFSVRWSGRFTVDPGEYELVATADDGMRVWLDGEPIVDAWVDQPPTEYRVNRTLAAGDHQLMVEYYNATGGGTSRVTWISLAPPD